MKKKKVRKGLQAYTMAEKVEALTKLWDNNYNVSKTFRETGISVMTLRRWLDRLDPIVRLLYEKFDGDLSKITSAEVNRYKNAPATHLAGEDAEDYDKLVVQAKILAIKRLKALIPNEIDTKKVADAVKLLNDINADDGSQLSRDGMMLDKYANFLLAGYTKETKVIVNETTN